MPQLDQITYFSQVSWLIITFIIFYTFFLKDYMPFLLKLKKLRQEKISNHFNSIVFFSYVNVEVLYSRWNTLRNVVA